MEKKMITKKEILEALGNDMYKPMFDQISIADFYKCIAQFSGLKIQEISNSAMLEYLTLWAKNKYRFFQLLGNKVKKDIPFTYAASIEDSMISGAWTELAKSYPVYVPWISVFKRFAKNKIERNQLGRGYYTVWLEDWADENISGGWRGLDGMSITHFFKKYLFAPEEIVTKIGRIYENANVEATYTISIDPVDMMLASENPYDWNSCYRLTLDNDSSHADGCLASVLDTSTLIAYLWTKEGKYTLKDMNYTLNNVRYKRMRFWVAINKDWKAIHFNKPYPTCNSYNDEFKKSLRTVIEDLIANEKFPEVSNVWINNKKIENYYKRYHCYRSNSYGYNEYDRDYIYILKEAMSEDDCIEDWEVYDERIICPCGCDCYLPGSDSDEDDDEAYSYTGGGFTYDNFMERENRYWCDCADDYCEIEEGSMYCREDCPHWRACHPLCEADNSIECEEAGRRDLEVDDGIAICGRNCEGCPFYNEHHGIEEFDRESCETEESIESYSYIAAPSDNITTITFRPTESHFQYSINEDIVNTGMWILTPSPTVNLIDNTNQDTIIER